MSGIIETLEQELGQEAELRELRAWERRQSQRLPGVSELKEIEERELRALGVSQKERAFRELQDLRQLHAQREVALLRKLRATTQGRKR